jgi:hypothetical protein
MMAVVCGVGSASTGTASGSQISGGVYGGLGTWLDIFAADSIWDNPTRFVAQAKEEHVHTLYVQTSNYSQSTAIIRPLALGAIVDAAHAAGLEVVGWYLPGLAQPRRDARRALAAIRFRTTSGQRLDGFGLDIEASIVRNVRLRNDRLLALSGLLRRSAPAGYPLGAIIPSPVGMRRHPTYWPGFPYGALAHSYDAFLPMGYFSYYAHTARATYLYTKTVIRSLRSQVGNAVPIHVIGGSSEHMQASLLAAFGQAASDCGVQGISLYAFPETSRADWTVLTAARLGTAAPSCEE